MMRFLHRMRRTQSETKEPLVLQPRDVVPSDHRTTASRIVFRATQEFMQGVRRDLGRKHPFAHERVGFITARAARGAEGLVIFADGYHVVPDNDYIQAKSVGAMLGSEALRKALELALLQGVGVFHVHMHGPAPRLWFSGIDLREQLKFIPDFFTVCPQMPHGAIVLDQHRAAGRVWLAPDRIEMIEEFNTVGKQLVIDRPAYGDQREQT